MYDVTKSIKVRVGTHKCKRKSLGIKVRSGSSPTKFKGNTKQVVSDEESKS